MADFERDRIGDAFLNNGQLCTDGDLLHSHLHLAGLQAQVMGGSPFVDLIGWIQTNLDTPLDVSSLVERIVQAGKLRNPGYAGDGCRALRKVPAAG